MPPQTSSKREAEIEGRMSALEAQQTATQENIRELTQIVADLAHETRRSLSIIQRPNWQYLAVLLGVVLALGSIYNRDQGLQDAETRGLRDWQKQSVHDAGKQEGLMEGLSEQVRVLRSEMKDLHRSK